MQTWVSALDAQLDLIRFWHTAEGAQAANMATVIPALLQGVAGFTVDDLNDPAVAEQVRQVGRRAADEAAEHLERAATYWLADEVNALIAAAGPTLPAVRLRPEDLPQPAGFIFFETPFSLPPIDVPPDLPPGVGDVNDVRVMHWVAGDGYVEVVPYFLGLVATTPLGTPVGALRWQFGEPSPTGSPSRLVLARVMIAFWLLSQQRVTSPRGEQPPRPVRRRAERAGFRIDDEGIGVVTLRRSAHSTTDNQTAPHNVDWACRWVVGGHWRQQWYPSLGHHRPVWINPYLKGPESKPLVTKDKTIYRWVR